jgi:hypothetical protein
MKTLYDNVINPKVNASPDSPCLIIKKVFICYLSSIKKQPGNKAPEAPGKIINDNN